MLLREFTIDDHVISLIQDEKIYIAQVLSSQGDKVFYHEYNDYDKIKPFFSDIVGRIERGECSIEVVLDILRSSEE